MNHQQKVERWAEKEIRRNFDHLIIDDGNQLIAFGFYYLEQRDQGWVVSDQDRVIHQFQNKKTAISWCVADKYKRYQLANNIINLDRKKQTIAADIESPLHICVLL